MRRFILVSLVVVVLILIFRFIFYSPVLSNSTSIVTLRNQYQDTIWKIKGIFTNDKSKLPITDPVYAFEVQKWSDTNLYTLRGTFVKAEPELGLIYISSDNKTYVFRVSKNFASKQADFDFGENVYMPSQDTVNIDELLFTTESKIKIMWDDERTLTKIFSDYSKNKERPLNIDSDRFFLIHKRG